MKLWSVLVLAVIMVILFIGVILYVLLGPKPQVESTGGCKSDEDCSSGICQGGLCVRTNECTTSTDCGEGNACNGGRCTSVSCSSNSQCPVGLSCQRGQCQRQTCTTNDECQGDSFCIAGVCVPNSCKSSYQCPSGYGCGSSGICYRNDIVCKTSDDCHDGSLQCIDGICNGPGSCPSGWLEYRGFCYPITNQLLCEGDTYPIAGVCCPWDEYLGKSCTGNSECGGSNPYCLDNRCRCTKAKVPQTFPSYPFARCSNTESCEGNANCSFGYCIPSDYVCVGSEDCASGSVCIAGACKQTGGNMEGAYCITSSDYITCMSSGRACVNAICSTRRGNIGDICIVNTDCISGLECSDRSGSGQISSCNLK